VQEMFSKERQLTVVVASTNGFCPWIVNSKNGGDEYEVARSIAFRSFHLGPGW